MENPTSKKKYSFDSKTIRKIFLYLTMYTFFVVTIVTIVTPIMSNNQAHNAIFGSFDSTGAAILLVGFPWLCLEYLKYHQ